MSKLEVNERLQFSGLHLNGEKDSPNDKSRLQDKTSTRQYQGPGFRQPLVEDMRPRGDNEQERNQRIPLRKENDRARVQAGRDPAKYRKGRLP